MAHILVIDDEAAIRRFLRISLIAEGHQVSEAVGVNEGLEQYRHLNPDLVILDLGLPDGDGIQVLQAIREHHPNPVLVLWPAIRSRRRCGCWMPAPTTT